MNWYMIPGAIFGLAVLSHSSSARAEDVAVVVGINQYISKRSLKGCINDASAIEAVLKAYGFKTTLLTDRTATKQAILNAIKAAKTKHPNRFVFYFAGHGTTLDNDQGALVPYDFKYSNEYTAISAVDLYDAVRQVPAQSRSVILDSCHSGAMSRGKSFLPTGFVPRFLPSKNMVEKIKRPAQVVSGVHEEGFALQPNNPADAHPICYYVACGPDELAGESQLGGKRRGFFTYFLTDMFQVKPMAWGGLNARVTGRLEAMQIPQRPQLTASYVEKNVFNIGPVSPSASSNAWEAFNGSRYDTTKLQLFLDPRKSVFALNDSMELHVESGTPGYLIVLEHGTDGSMIVHYPKTLKVDDAHIGSGTRVPKDENLEFTFDSPGFEEVRAILYRKKETAAQVLAGLKASMPDPSQRTIPLSNLATLRKNLQSRNGAGTHSVQETLNVYSADVRFTVVNGHK